MTVKSKSPKLRAFIQSRVNNNLQLQKILVNTSWLFGDRILRFGVGIIVGAWIARYLGPSQFGQFNYAIAFVALFIPFANLGLDSIVVRNIVQDPNPNHVNEILGSAFLLKILGGIIVVFATVFGVILLRPGDSVMQLIVAALAISTVFQAFDIIDLLFQSKVQSKYTVMARMGAYLVTALIRIVLILIKAPLITFALANFAEVLLGAFGLVVIYLQTDGVFSRWKPSLKQAKGLLRDSWPLILSGFAIMLYMKIDQIMLGSLANDKAVGIYSAAVRLSELWYFIPMAIVTSTFPAIVAAKQMGADTYETRIQKLFNLMTGLAYVIALPMTFLSSIVVVALYGTSYAEAGPILAVHIWAGISVFLGVARESWMTSEGLMKYSFITTLGGAVTNIALNYVLIPIYGPMGAAIATVVAYTVAGFAMCFVFRATRPVAKMMAKALIFRM